MMKRMLALLLAVLLLPAGALAEAFRLDMTISMDVDNAAAFFKASGLFAGASNEEKICRTFAELVDGAALHVVSQDDAFTLDVAFDDTSLLDLAVVTGETELIISSSLMNGSVMSMPMEQDSLQEDAFVKLMEETDWVMLLGGMVMNVANRLDGLEVETVRGSFSGDAYTGGVYCTTYSIDDEDLAGLIGAMMTEDFRALVLAACNYWDLDGAGFLAQIDEKNAAVAQANAHRYMVRLVYDAEHMPVGVSAVVLRGDEQLGTFSLGIALQEDEIVLKTVIGFGLQDSNYWHSHEICMTSQETAEGYSSVTLSGELREFTAPKSDDFAFAAATVASYRMSNDWKLTVNIEGGNYSWQYDFTERMGNSAPLMKTEGQGLYLPGTRLVNNVTYSMDGKAYMTEKLICAPCAPVEIDTTGMNVIGADADEDTLTQLGMTIGFGLVERLMKVIPMELLLYMQ